MPRLRLYDVRLSRLPELVGKCQGDVPSIANFVNSAQRRLLLCREAGDDGWYGTWAEVAFRPISRTNPHITLPRDMARIEKLQVCQHPVFVQNQFYEYLDFGNGRMPKTFRQQDNWCLPQGYTRNNVVTWVDQTIKPCIYRIYTNNTADVQAAKRVFFSGLDSTDTVVYTQDAQNEVQGEFVACDSPFADTVTRWNALTGIQKDVTAGQIQIFEVDPATGAQTLVLIMEPTEQVAGYRRYYLNNLPLSCCNPASSTPQELTVTAIVKLDLVPVFTDTDYLLFQNLEAIIEEAQSVRYSEIDSTSAKQMAQEKHVQAIRLLQGELVHYLGKERPAVNFAPFGSAKLTCAGIGYQT